MALLVYESLTAGALGPDPPASLLREGFAMRSAIAHDFTQFGESVRTLDRDADFDEAVDSCDDVLVIAPEFDGHLEQRSRRVLERGRRLLGSSPTAIAIAADKMRLAQLWRDRGVPTPETSLLPRSDARLSFAAPVVVKPRDGAGSWATRWIRDQSEAASVLAELREERSIGDFLVQRWVAGRSCSVSFLLGPAGAIPLRAGEQRLSDDGRFQYCGGRLPLSGRDSERAIELAHAAISVIDGLAGFVGVDLILGEREWAIEVNPRLTTSYIGLRTLCRDNLAAAWRSVLKGKTPTLSWKSGTVLFDADGRATIEGM